VAEAKAASMFEVTLITESANHKRYRVSLRSSSKRAGKNLFKRERKHRLYPT
jgi:hypothetical protein